jgi:hypothetical protein
MIPRIAGGVSADEVAVSAVDRNGNESAPVMLGLTSSP